MDAQNPTKSHFTVPYYPGRIPPLEDDPARKVVEAVWRELDQMRREGKEISLPRSYTIREAAEKTGRPRHEIYRLIRQGKIEARMGLDGPALWLIPEEEVEKLMPEAPGDQATPAPAEVPGGDPNLISNN